MAQESPHECDTSRAAEIDRRLVALGRGVGGMRLRIGEALERFANRGGAATFGFSSIAAYAVERLGRSGHWAADARSLARRLAELPRLRAALVAGTLGASMVELLARNAMPLTEAELIAEAQAPGMTVRAMRARLAKDERMVTGAEPERATVVAIVDSAEALAFERARMLVEAVGDTRSRDEVIEAMLAEGLGEILSRRPGVGSVSDPEARLPANILTAHPKMPIPEGLGADAHPAKAAWKAELAASACKAEIAAEADFAAFSREGLAWVRFGPHSEAARDFASGPFALDRDAEIETELPDAPYALDAQLREWVTQLAGRDLELAGLASQMSGGHLYRTLGYASFEQYVRERIGLSPSALEARFTLARRAEAMPELGAAIASGRIGFEAASLVARVARGTSVSAWIAEAEMRTVKHLREEVDAATMIARVSGCRAVMGPPDEGTMEELREVERSALESVTQMSGGRGNEGPRVEFDRQTPPPVRAGRVRLSLSLREDVARFWRIVEAMHRNVAPEESFVWFLCAAVERAWRGAHAGKVAYQDVYLRDRFRCANPTCSRRDVTPHHIVFRSHGGGEERSNLVSLCTVCHLELVHGGRIRVTGEGPERLKWRLGDDVVVVNGRRLVARVGAGCGR